MTYWEDKGKYQDLRDNISRFISGDLEFDPEPDIPKDYPFKNYNHLDPEYEGIDRI